jgi:hydrogenase maturation protease
MKEILIIGYGNTLRGDDGAGYRVAEMVSEWGIEKVRSLPVHQLTPELAEAIAAAKLAIFIDAYSDGNSQGLQVRSLEVEEGNDISATTHSCDPRSLLQIAQFLYGNAPPAWWLLVPAVNFEFTEELSFITQKSMAQALSKIKELIN